MSVRLHLHLAQIILDPARYAREEAARLAAAKRAAVRRQFRAQQPWLFSDLPRRARIMEGRDHVT